MTAFHKTIKLNKYTINRDKRKHIYFPKIIRRDRQTTTDSGQKYSDVSNFPLIFYLI